MNLPNARSRPKRTYTPEEEADRLERRRASGRIRSARYYARLREEKKEQKQARQSHYVAVCSHSCGCSNEITIPVCGLCKQGLCEVTE